MTPLLAVDRLAVRSHREGAIVHDVSFRVGRGELLTLVGETGAGKSLIAAALVGILPPGLAVSGAMRFAGGSDIALADTGSLAALRGRAILLLPQEPTGALDPTMRIGRQLAHADPAPAAVGAALAAVGLDGTAARAMPDALSGGMGQRVLVAFAGLSRASLVIADEPTKGLDRALVGQTVTLLAGLLAAGRSVLLITHDLSLPRALGGRIVILEGGRVVEHGDAATVLNAPAHCRTRRLLAADPAAWPKRTPRPPGAPVVAATGLRFAYPGRPPLFDRLDVSVAAGEIVAVTGPSGCGKTTLGNVLLGLARPGHGRVVWAGADPYAAPQPYLRRRYQKLHQDPASVFIPGRPIGLQLAALARVAPDLDLAAALPPLLARLHLSPALLTRPVEAISGGEAQRLALARVLLLGPRLLVADEPTSRLDPVVQKETIDLLAGLVAADGLALLLISHDPALVAAVADCTVALADRRTAARAA